MTLQEKHLDAIDTKGTKFISYDEIVLNEIKELKQKK
jgi:hypothetical protein